MKSRKLSDSSMFGSRLMLFGSDSITSGAVLLREEFCSVSNLFFGAMVDNNVGNRKTLVEETNIDIMAVLRT